MKTTTNRQLTRRERTTAPASGSTRARLLMLVSGILGASLATAVASTTLTGLLVANEPVSIEPVAAPATRPATQPVEVPQATAHEAIHDVLPTLPVATGALADDLIHAEIGGGRIVEIDADGLLRASEASIVGATRGPIIVVAAGASAPSAFQHVAAEGRLDRVAPVTFAGSPDLADAGLYRAFRGELGGSYRPAGAYNAAGEVVSDVVPVLGMDETDAAPRQPRDARGQADARNQGDARGLGDASPLPYEQIVNARPSGEFAPVTNTGPADEEAISRAPVIDPWDGGGRGNSATGFWYNGQWIPGAPDAITPEPTLALTLLAAGGTLLRRRRR